MERNTALTWSWLNVLNKKRYDVLTEVYGDLESALNNLDENLLKSLGCREETVFDALNRLDEFDPSAYEFELNKRGLSLINLEDASYPTLLKQVPDHPTFLYYRGDLDVLNQPCIALVGTREISPYGKRATEEFVPSIVRSGVVTVSGLAQGIDTAVAKETLTAGGKTVAVLGHGLARVFPKSNEKLADQIIDEGGLIISEYPLDVPPDKHTFPARNRIIAGLSIGIVVLEAGESSGALITADLALDYGREVFAVPGQVFDKNYVGCHHIISRGHAKLVSTPEEILSEIGISASESQETSSYNPQNEQEDQVFKVLTSMPQSVDEITDKSEMKAAEILSTLTMMEIAGATRNVGEGKWVRIS